MTLLFWSLPVSPLLSHPIPELGGGGREIEEVKWVIYREVKRLS